MTWHPARPFDWRDGDRSVHYGRGRVAEAVELLGGPGYTLLTTGRAAGAAPPVVEAAAAVHEVPAGLVDEIAAGMLGSVEGERIVALGGGRVIDVAKAIAAARGSGTVGAAPTTLSGAEMTRGHRHARGVDPSTPRVRPALVVNDPQLCASQPVSDLAASALNALGHAIEGPCTPKANPVSALAAAAAVRLLTEAFGDGEPDRDALALGALLAGYTIDSAGYGLHHVMSQTIVRAGGVAHATANAVLLPHTTRALARRVPDRVPAGAAAEAARVCAVTGTTRLGLAEDVLEKAAGIAAERSELAHTPPWADREELLDIYRAAN